MNNRKIMMAQNLTKLMRSKNMTTADLGRATDIPYTTINEWLKAKSFPKDDRLEQISAYFKVDTNELRNGRIRAISAISKPVQYVSAHLGDVPQVEHFRRLLDAYQNADEKTQRAVRVLLDMDD